MYPANGTGYQKRPDIRYNPKPQGGRLHPLVLVGLRGVPVSMLSPIPTTEEMKTIYLSVKKFGWTRY